jgi:hypothetical protein
MLLSKGDNGPPCGVPSSTGLASPPSITPAFRNVRISFSTRPSLTLVFDSGHQFAVRNPVEEHHHTLPIIGTFPNASPSLARIILSMANR